MRLITTLCLVLLVSCSQEVPTEVTPQPLEVVTGPFLIRDGIYYHQDTNELVTGTVEEFHDNGHLKERGNYIDGVPDGLFEDFDEDGNLTKTETWENGEVVEYNLNP